MQLVHLPQSCLENREIPGRVERKVSANAKHAPARVTAEALHIRVNRLTVSIVSENGYDMAALIVGHALVARVCLQVIATNPPGQKIVVFTLIATLHVIGHPGLIAQDRGLGHHLTTGDDPQAIMEARLITHPAHLADIVQDHPDGIDRDHHHRAPLHAHLPADIDQGLLEDIVLDPHGDIALGLPGGTGQDPRPDIDQDLRGDIDHGPRDGTFLDHRRDTGRDHHGEVQGIDLGLLALDVQCPLHPCQLFYQQVCPQYRCMDCLLVQSCQVWECLNRIRPLFRQHPQHLNLP